MSACVRILSRVFVRSVWQSCSHFPSGAERYRKAGWLAGCTGKETVSIKQQMEDSMCLHCRNTHTHMQTHMHAILRTLCANTVAFIKSVTQIAHRKCQLWRIWSFHRALVEWGRWDNTLAFQNELLKCFHNSKDIFFLCEKLFCPLHFSQPLYLYFT